LALISPLGLSEVVDTLTFKDAVNEIAFVEAAISPLVATATILFAQLVFTFELDPSLLPCLLAEPVLVVIHPFTFVGGALGVDEGALAIGHAIHPLALIHTAISLDHATQPLHLVLAKLALVLRTVWPDQDAQAVLHLAALYKTPLSLIFLRYIFCVNCVHECAIDIARCLVIVNHIHLCIVEKSGSTFHSLLCRLP